MKRKFRRTSTWALAAVAATALILSACEPAPKKLNTDLPAGNLDVAELSTDGTSIHVAGWAADRNADSSIYVVIYIDGQLMPGLIRADKSRPDVTRATGAKYAPGFDHTLTISKRDSVHVCVSAVNVGPGDHTLLGCENLTPKEPVTPATPANVAPTAAFTSTADQTDPLNYTFDPSASIDVDGTIDSYFWRIDDVPATATTDALPFTTRFEAAGEYTVTLTVTDDDGAEHTTSKVISINEAPTAAFAFAAPNPTLGFTLNFDATGSTDPEGGELTYEWDFGDGSAIVTDAATTHSFTAAATTHSFTAATAGRYTVTLTVTDDDGAEDTTTQTFTVEAGGNFAPIPVVTTTPDETNPLMVTLDASGSIDPDGTITSYAWTVNGTATTGASVTVLVEAPGTYSADVTLNDDGGFIGSFTIEFEVHAAPDA